MNVFGHRYSRKFVSLNYKVMYTFFNESPRFTKKYAGSCLKDRSLSVKVDVMLVRNPFDKLASFYSNKILAGECVTLKKEFVDLLSRKFGFDVFSTPKNKIADGIPLEGFMDCIEDLFMGEPHLYPQNHCLKWIEPSRFVKIESEMGVLADMFPDLDFSVKKNVSKTKTVLDDRAKAKVMSLYEEDFRMFYPELLV